MATPSPSALAVQFTLVLIFAEWIRRVLWILSFRRVNPPLSPVPAPPAAPKVSVIVPARDEESNIGRCLDRLFKQEYPDYELLVVDDRSSDRTPEILRERASSSPVPFRAVRVEKLPPGWTGKNHAMHVGAKAASGEWLLFTDADTTHSPRSVATAVAAAEARGIDLLTLAPETESYGFWEKTVQPLAVSSLALWFDPVKVNDPKSGVTIANGQFILIRRSVYERVGGSEAVKHQVVEDVELARAVRASGFSVQFLDGTKLYSTRMYSSLAQIHRGWTRIFIHLFSKSVPAIAHKIFLFLFFSILPFAVLAVQGLLWAGGSARFDPLTAGLAAGLCGWIVAVRFAGSRMVRANPWYSLLHPVASLVMVWILGTCVWRIWLDRPSLWRGDSHR